MSLKSRLLKNREIKSFTTVQENNSFNLITYFREHKDFDRLFVYSYDKMFAEKNGNIIKILINFPSEQAYLKEIERIIKYFDADSKDEDIITIIKDDIIIKIILVPEVANEPYISIERKKDLSYSTYFKSKLISSEIAAYFRACLKQKANIFIVGNASVDKSPILNFLLELSNNNKNLVYGKTENITSRNSCYMEISKNCLKNIYEIPYNNIFCSDIRQKDLITIFQLIVSGYNGFVVSMSMKDNIDIFTAIRNIILLENINLFEENADFLTSSSIDIVVFVNNTNNNDISIVKISEISKNKQNITVLKDIFIKNTNNTYVSTGNPSKFYNTKNTNTFLQEYLEENHVHSYVSGITSNTDISNVKIPEMTEKRKKLKEKLKQLKQEKNYPNFELNNIQAKTTSEQEEVVNQNELKMDNHVFELTNFSTQENDIETNENLTENKEDIINNTLFGETKIKNILEDNDEENNENKERDVNTLDNNAIEELKDTVHVTNIEEKYTSNLEEQIVEEPELFSEITDKDIDEYNENLLDIDNEDI